MKFLDEFRDPAKAQALITDMRRLVQDIRPTGNRPIWIMEICGGHTHTIFRHGLHHIIPQEIEFVHGPGCPVCVLPRGRVDDCVALAEQPNVIMTTFGDAMRVTGSQKNLLQAKAEGADVRMVYSPLDALAIARQRPEKEVVFLGLGFETTMPSTAFTLIQAKQEGITNFSLFSNHITIIPTIKTILDSPNLQLDGLLGPGHVSMVIGVTPYACLASHYHKPIVIAGFEPLDILQALWMVLKQLAEGRHDVENQYHRVVSTHGNRQALAAINQVFELRDRFEWRGLGSIDQSGVCIRPAFAAYDAERKFTVPNVTVTDPSSCQCGEVLTGAIKPVQCQAFGSLCTPEHPLGALMVSTEGACAAYYHYGWMDDTQGQPLHR